MKFLFLLIFLFSCSAKSPPPPIIETVCKETHTDLKFDSDAICGAAMLCSFGISGKFSSYFCVCDQVCICFFKTAERTIGCGTVDDLDCDKDGFMTFFGKDFCKLKEATKFEILKTLGQQIKDGESG
jgi:hypothetical protein